MKMNTMKPTAHVAEGDVFLGENWFDPLEAAVRTRVRGFIEELLEAELDAALTRKRYERPSLSETEAAKAPGAAGHRHGHRGRQLMGTFGPVRVRVPRARLETSDGKTVEWKNATIPAYQRRTKQANALIAGAYLAGTNTRRVRRALAALFGGAVGKDTVSRVWRKVKGDWDAWNARSLADEPIIRLILDGTVVRVRFAKRGNPFRTAIKHLRYEIHRPLSDVKINAEEFLDADDRSHENRARVDAQIGFEILVARIPCRLTRQDRQHKGLAIPGIPADYRAAEIFCSGFFCSMIKRPASIEASRHGRAGGSSA